MSDIAVRWALKQRTRKSSDKLVLISLADRAGKDNRAWPSRKRLSYDTQLNIKTVQGCVKSLMEDGFIRDTGHRTGQKNKVVVYQLIGAPENNSNPNVEDYPSLEIQPPLEAYEGGYSNEPENGPVYSESPVNEPETDPLPASNEPDFGQTNQPNIGPLNLSVIELSKDNNLCANSCASEVDHEEVWISHKRKKLTGERLAKFKAFWEAFNYKKSRARAIDAWLKAGWSKDKQANHALHDQIIFAAQREAQRRPGLMQRGRTPIYAEGWLTGRRWEDEETQEPTGVIHDVNPCRSAAERRAAVSRFTLDLDVANW